MRLGAALAALAASAACTSGSSSTDTPCESALDCPVALVCAADGFCTLDERADATSRADAVGRDAGAPHDATTDADPLRGEGPNDELAEWGIRALHNAPRPELGRLETNRHAYCGIEQVVVDDFDGYYDDFVPAERFVADPVPDEVARCGDDDETLAWRLSNCERMSRSLPPLACDLRLVWVGRMHSDDMRVRDFFDHDNPDGLDPFDRMRERGIDSVSGLENIAWYPTIVDAHVGWMNSDGHRRNILHEVVTHQGIGVIRDGTQHFLTAGFIRPRE